MLCNLFLFTGFVLGCFIAISIHLASNVERKCLNKSDLSPHLLAWEQKGSYHNIFGFKVFSMYFQKPAATMTYLIIHGYPTSSFDYSYGGLESLLSTGDVNILLHDHIGFGFSEKPISGFGYSIHDQADVTIQLWKKLSIEGDCVLVG